MIPLRSHPFPFLFAALLITGCGIVRAGDSDVAGSEFFEKKIRPALIENCFSCHSAQSKKIKGKLRVDTRALLLKGGESGAESA